MLKKTVASVVACLALAGLISACGGSSGNSNDTGITGVAKTTETTTAPSESSEGTMTKASLYRCIEGTDLKLAKEAGKIPGSNVYKANFELDGVDYAGFVVWPSGDLADIWIGPDSEAADAAREQYVATWKAFGRGDEGDKFVQASGNTVVGLDDEKTPTPDEVETLNACLAPEG